MDKPEPNCPFCHGTGSYEHDFIDMVISCECLTPQQDPYVKIITEMGGELIESDPRLVMFTK